VAFVLRAEVHEHDPADERREREHGARRDADIGALDRKTSGALARIEPLSKYLNNWRNF